MKKKKIIFILIFILLITGCGNKKVSNSVDDFEEKFGETTFRFVGKSEHYIFKYGLAYIKDKDDDIKRKINISGFEQTKKLKD